ncbi:MAG: phosphatidate cytidylyltransferase, partial [Hyphomicrobiaceae bacterium]
MANTTKSDLKPRLIAGVAMATVALALTYAGPLPFAAMVGLVAVLMCWEWGRVVRGRDFGVAFAAHAATVAVAVGLAAIGDMRLALAALAAGAILVLVAAGGGRREMSALGVAYVGLPALALIWFRNDGALGLYAVLFIFAVVWTSD